MAGGITRSQYGGSGGPRSTTIQRNPNAPAQYRGLNVSRNPYETGRGMPAPQSLPPLPVRYVGPAPIGIPHGPGQTLPRSGDAYGTWSSPPPRPQTVEDQYQLTPSTWAPPPNTTFVPRTPAPAPAPPRRAPDVPNTAGKSNRLATGQASQGGRPRYTPPKAAAPRQQAKPAPKVTKAPAKPRPAVAAKQLGMGKQRYQAIQKKVRQVQRRPQYRGEFGWGGNEPYASMNDPAVEQMRRHEGRAGRARAFEARYDSGLYTPTQAARGVYAQYGEHDPYRSTPMPAGYRGAMGYGPGYGTQQLGAVRGGYGSDPSFGPRRY